VRAHAYVKLQRRIAASSLPARPAGLSLSPGAGPGRPRDRPAWASTRSRWAAAARSSAPRAGTC